MKICHISRISLKNLHYYLEQKSSKISPCYEWTAMFSVAKYGIFYSRKCKSKRIYRSEMEIFEVHCQNFASYEQKIYQLVSPNLQVHCQNICATKNISPKDKKILYMTKRSYTITNPKQHWFLTILESSSFSSPYRFLDWSHPAWKEHNISKY